MTARSLEALRRLLLVTAAVCLLGTGGVDLVRAPAGAAPGASAGAAPGASAGAGAEPVPPATASALRSALAAATPLLGGDLAPPGDGRALALHPADVGGVPDDVRRAPGEPVEGPDGRGPPTTAGT